MKLKVIDKTTDNVVGINEPLKVNSLSSSSDFGWTRTYDKLRFKITDNSTDKNSVMKHQ